MTASPMTLDFTKEPEFYLHASGKLAPGERGYRKTAEGKSLSPKQIRARARRNLGRQGKQMLTKQEMSALYNKPIDEWDFEELAQGRPRGKDGGFNGPKPKWITQEVHEQSMEKFTALVKTNMRGSTVTALTMLQGILENDDEDEKGKPIVTPGVKVDVAKFLIEHAIGKPTQRVEQDMSVKLQGILGAVMMNTDPNSGQMFPGHFPGLTMELSTGPSDPDEIVYDG